MPFLPPYFTVQVGFAPLLQPFLAALREIEVESSIDQASIFRLHFDLSRTATGDWDVLQFDIFRPRVPVRISVSLGLGVPEVLINGYVRDDTLENRNEPGTSTLAIVGLDASSSLMNQVERPMTWPNLPDSEIVAVIFGIYGLLPNVFRTPPARTVVDTTTMQRVSDIRYAQALARKHGFECYLQPHPFLGIDVGHFRPPQVLAPPQGVLSSDFGIETNLADFRVHNDMMSARSVLAAWLDPDTKLPTLVPGLLATDLPMGLEPALQRIVPPPVERPLASDAANAAELMASARGRVNRSSQTIRASGEVDGIKYGRVLRPGLPVMIRGAGRKDSGPYYVTRVAHRVSRDSYTQRFDCWRNAVGLTGAEVFVDPVAAIE